MVAMLNVLGVIALVVGVVLWIAMLRYGLANWRGEPQRPSDRRLDKSTE